MSSTERLSELGQEPESLSMPARVRHQSAGVGPPPVEPDEPSADAPVV